MNFYNFVVQYFYAKVLCIINLRVCRDIYGKYYIYMKILLSDNSVCPIATLTYAVHWGGGVYCNNMTIKVLIFIIHGGRTTGTRFGEFLTFYRKITLNSVFLCTLTNFVQLFLFTMLCFFIINFQFQT